jgi:hypothetical protein
MKLLRALESVMSSSARPLWLNALIAAAVLYAMAAITADAGLPAAERVLTWLAILPLGFGVFGFTANVRDELRAVHA